jgi:hypothetical protein
MRRQLYLFCYPVEDQQHTNFFHYPPIFSGWPIRKHNILCHFSSRYDEGEAIFSPLLTDRLSVQTKGKAEDMTSTTRIAYFSYFWR